MEVIVCLKLEIDAAQIEEVSDTEDQIKSKIRAWIANIIGHTAIETEWMSLYSSCILAEIEGTDTMRVIPSHPVVKMPPDTKIQ